MDSTRNKQIRKEEITMHDNEKFTFEEVDNLTQHGYEESMVAWFEGYLNDVLDNKEYMVTSNLKEKLTKIFINDKLRGLLISSIQICEMAEFKMDSYSEFDAIIHDLLELNEQLK
jgi:hypothetical protein